MLPPATNPQRKTLLLDLDETLVHVTQDPTEKYTFSLVLDISGKPTPFYISTRPYLDQFLSEASQSFELVLFTAAEKVYADPITSAIDPKGLITHRLYRDHCMQWRGRLVKDLSCLGRSLRKVVIIDVRNRQDSEENFKFQPTNGVKIEKFRGDLRDTALLDLLPLLEKVKGAADARGVVESLIKMNKHPTIY
jgi:RNA polymerase II subunit A small phosphatase-like protein